MSTVERINITFYYSGYKVSKPNWEGGEVVLSKDYDALKVERDRAMKALHDLTPGGSEYFNDIERCVSTIRHTRDVLMRQFVNERKRTHALEAEIKRLREECEKHD